jgi:LCP family protein required for cell wall assembly
LFFTTVRALVSRTTLPFVDNVVQTEHTPGRAPQEELPNISQRKERINILLLGIDRREKDPGPWRTDTMILVSLDPATNSASMLSIPRDLWVDIPGYGESRINTAHSTGDQQKYPGGGVALAKKTVSTALGVPVHYYVRIDFFGFERLVDAIGGLDIYVKEPIHDEEYPDGNYGTFVLDIPAGPQHMNGERALQYARTRHGTGDFNRMARQQEVIKAALDKVLKLDIPLSRVPELIELAGDSLQTDLVLSEILALIPIVKNLAPEDIQAAVIDGSMTISTVTPAGWWVEVPDWTKIHPLVDQLFPPSLAMVPSPSAARAQLAQEDSRIELQNGTLASGLAEETTESLRELGFNVIRYGNAERSDYVHTLIVAYAADKQYTVTTLAQQLGVRPENILRREGEGGDVDISVILGQDYLEVAKRQE